MGQCSVTALVAQDVLGGEIRKTLVDGGWHFYNLVDGVRHDFTVSQFSSPIRYDDTASSREDAFSDTTETQYQALRRAFLRL